MVPDTYRFGPDGQSDGLDEVHHRVSTMMAIPPLMDGKAVLGGEMDFLSCGRSGTVKTRRRNAAFFFRKNPATDQTRV